MTVSSAPVRETPSFALLDKTATDPARKTVFKEPVLAIENIQGSILTGFNKSHRFLISLRVNEKGHGRVAALKKWLRAESAHVATASEVIAFNSLFKATRIRRGREGAVKSTWMGLSLSYRLLKTLTGESPDFADKAFAQGLAKRSKDLGDPTQGEFAPEQWLVGGPKNEADIFLIVESDDRAGLLDEWSRLEASINAANATHDGGPLLIETLFVDEGENLPPPLEGHEHFGFLDGVSQPGLRGLLSHDDTDVLTLRQNPHKRDQLGDIDPATGQRLIQPAQGKPGQDLLYPGEFIFGYPRQNPDKDPRADGLNPFPGDDSLKFDPGKKVSPAGPPWAQDGSFLVYRRLRQDVGEFHTFLSQTAKHCKIVDPANASAARLVGSRLVGRWPSGTPVERTPDGEDINLGNDDCKNNNFEFNGDTPPIPKDANDPSACVDINSPQSTSDSTGAKCPFSAHIRKAYPRDEEGNPPSDPKLSESATQTHRLLRRGLPYGQVSSSTPDVPFIEDARHRVDRGLQFLCYQTSIENQFEFVIRNWVNDPDFKVPFIPDKPDGPPEKQGGGHDPILGQNGKDHDRARHFNITVPDGTGGAKAVQLKTNADWVHPTAGGYFFTPSISALAGVLTDL